MNTSQQKLLCAIQREGQTSNLFRIAVVVEGMQYAKAHRALTQLERAGLVRVENRRPGSRLVMEAKNE